MESGLVVVAVVSMFDVVVVGNIAPGCVAGSAVGDFGKKFV